MKPVFILLLFASSFLAKSSNASDIISAKALKSFQTTFTAAKEVAWATTDKYFKVQFILNEQTLTAFYNVEGKLLGVTRNISSTQLPVMLLAEIKSRYCNEWISELFEVSSDNGTDYYITLENAATKTVLKSSNSSGWSLYKKTKKS